MEHSAEGLCEIHAIVNGSHIQDSGFRSTTCYFARNLGLKGTVGNMPDGSVEIRAQGPREQLEELLLQLYDEMSNVEETNVKYVPLEHICEDFRIVYY
jgi:acylphosphatase